MLVKFYKYAILWLGWILGPYLIYESTADYFRTRALEAGGSVVEARVVDAGVDSHMASASEYSVQYAFEANGATYGYVNSYGGRRGWARLTPDAYERAKAERTVAVRYDPSDPSNNQPVAMPPVPMLNRVVGVVLGAGCTLLSLLGLASLLITGLGRKAASSEGEGEA